jgi:acetyltransferase-like isoleucine patch superfamily enzyme
MIHLEVHGRLEIGDGVRLISGYSNFVGAEQPLAMWIGPEGVLRLQDGCRVSNSTIVASQRVEILVGTYIGGGCRIYDTDFHQANPDERLADRGCVATAPVCIGPRAFVGGHCIVLKGVSVGEGAIIGAGSVVTRDVPAFEIWAGVPARKIRGLA